MKNMLIVIALFAVWTNVASAHTKLSKYTQADGEVLSTAPENVQLVYTESVRLLRADLLLIRDDAAEKLDIGFEPASTAAAQHSVDLPRLAKGQYRIEWAVMGADGHPVQGSFTFGIGMTPTHDADVESHSHGSH